MDDRQLRRLFRGCLYFFAMEEAPTLKRLHARIPLDTVWEISIELRCVDHQCQEACRSDGGVAPVAIQNAGPLAAFTSVVSTAYTVRADTCEERNGQQDGRRLA